MILQRRSPLTASVGRALLQVVLGRVGQLVEDVTDGLPVFQILGTHNRSTGHEVHGGAHHIIGITHADDIGIGHIGP